MRSKILPAILIFITTLFFVSATDLSDYPEPFFEDGSIDALMIAGEKSSPADLLGLIEIANSMQYSAMIEETIDVEYNEPFVTGDAVKAWRAGDWLEIDELLGDVTETYDGSDALALRSYMVTTQKGSTQANQYLRFAWGNTSSTRSAAKVIFAEDEDENIGDFLLFEDSQPAFQYELEFETGLESEMSSGELPDLESENLNILGSDFSIVDADYSTADGIKLTLMGGSVEDILGEGISRTYVVDDKEYEVTLAIVSDWSGAGEDAKVKFRVNGVLTKELSAGETAVLQDGTVLGVKEVLPNEAGETGSGDIVAFYLGAYKVELSDVYSAGSWDGTVEVDGDNIEDAELIVSYTESDDIVTVRKISYRLTSDSLNEGYVPPGSGLRSFLREPEGMLGENWDVRYEGLKNKGNSEIEISPRGDDEYRMTFSNSQGIVYTLRLAFANSSGLYYGDDDRSLVFNQGEGTGTANFTIRPSDYFIVSHDGDSHRGVTRILQFDSFDTSEGLVRFTDVGTGTAITSTYSGTLASSWSDCSGQFNVGGYTFDYYCVDSGLLVDLDDDGSVGGEAGVVVEGGGILDLGTQPVGSYRPVVANAYINITTPASMFNERDVAESFAIDITRSGSEVDISLVSGFSLYSTDSDNYYGMSDYGAKVTLRAESDGPDSVLIEYPVEQLLPQVYVSFEEFFSVGSSSGTAVIRRYPEVNMGSAYSGEQPSDISKHKVISVGGPCVNAVTAELMGLEYPACGDKSGINPDEGFIRSYNGGKALVVAGWDEGVTRKLINVLLDYEWQQGNNILKGDAYLIDRE